MLIHKCSFILLYKFVAAVLGALESSKSNRQTLWLLPLGTQCDSCTATGTGNVSAEKIGHLDSYERNVWVGSICIAQYIRH